MELKFLASFSFIFGLHTQRVSKSWERKSLSNSERKCFSNLRQESVYQTWDKEVFIKLGTRECLSNLEHKSVYQKCDPINRLILFSFHSPTPVCSILVWLTLHVNILNIQSLPPRHACIRYTFLYQGRLKDTSSSVQTGNLLGENSGHY